MSAYGLVHDVAYEGTRADSRPAMISSGRNNSGADMLFGRFVTFDGGSGTSDLAIKPRSAAGEKNLGVLIHDMAHELAPSGAAGNLGLPDDGLGAVLKEGAVWMVAENTVTPGSKVYVRHTANGSPGASDGIGRVRSDADAVAQVQTLTPTATNGAIYVVRVAFVSGEVYEFEAVGDGSATATEIVTSLKAAMAADAGFTARIVATGTTTLILTAQNASLDVSTAASAGDGAIAVVNTTPAVPHADLEPRASFLSGGTIGQLVMLHLNLP